MFNLPANGEIVFQELAAPVLAGVDAVDKRIAYAGSTVNNVEWRLKVVHLLFVVGNIGRIFVGYPTFV